MVLGLQEVVFSRRSVISLVLMGAYFHTIFMTSYSASEIWGKADIVVPPNKSYICNKNIISGKQESVKNICSFLRFDLYTFRSLFAIMCERMEIENRKASQGVFSVIGSGETLTIANVIQQVNKPMLIIAQNKTLAAQLCGEFKGFFRITP